MRLEEGTVEESEVDEGGVYCSPSSRMFWSELVLTLPTKHLAKLCSRVQCSASELQWAWHSRLMLWYSLCAASGALMTEPLSLL